METYKLEINKEEFLGMLSNYFTLKLEKPIQVKEELTVSTNMRGDKETYVKIYFEETIQILGHTAVKTTILSNDQVKGILTELVNDENLVIESLYYRTPSVWKGYGFDEHQETEFGGVTLQVREKQKQLRK